ncbi:MAG: hypothetical protein ABIG63_07195 [Chloroflexota bacterium]
MWILHPGSAILLPEGHSQETSPSGEETGPSGWGEAAIGVCYNPGKRQVPKYSL